MCLEGERTLKAKKIEIKMRFVGKRFYEKFVGMLETFVISRAKKGF